MGAQALLSELLIVRLAVIRRRVRKQPSLLNTITPAMPAFLLAEAASESGLVSRESRA